MPSLTARMEYLKSIYTRYQRAKKEKKSRILEEFCQVNKYNRKYAIRLLNGPLPDSEGIRVRRKPFLYSHRAVEIAAAIWAASGYLCSQRLKEAIPLWLPAARKRFALTPGIEKELLSISARQLEYRLRKRKNRYKKRIYSTTRPGFFLKHMIPVRTHNWDINKPGFLEIDLVAHCGNSLSGTFINTLNATDIETGWTERAAVMGKGQAAVFDGLMDIKNAIPFRLRGIDSDNGEEFINYHLLNYCRSSRPQIAFTRGRAYKKDDNAHVEQKNWTHVRRIFGWDRYDTEQAQEAMNDLYDNELRLFQNLFQPSLKMRKKTRVGSKIIRQYEPAKTPFQRLLDSGLYNKAKVKELQEFRDALDPFELSKTIDQKLDRVFKLASERIRTKQQVECLQKRALEQAGMYENGQTMAAHRALVDNFLFTRKGRWLHRKMNRINREPALTK